MESFTDIKIEFEFSDDTWTDVYDDVIGSIQVSAGIRGYGLLDRVAGTGTCKLTLENRGNVYTPGHTSCTSGFEEGTPFRIRFTYDGKTAIKYYGRIKDIKVKPGAGITYYTDVIVTDYIDLLATHELELPEFAEDKTLDNIVARVIDETSIPAANVVSGYGNSIFETVFDTTSARTIALQEIAKATISELGYVYVIPYVGNPLDRIVAGDENVMVEGRYSSYLFETSSITLTDEDVVGMELQYAGNYFNDIRTIVYPRQVDSAATSVLFEIVDPINVQPGDTVYYTGRFRDPNQEAQQVSGIDMVTPVATTDYLFNTASDGGGSDITTDLVVTATYGANGVKYTLTNNNAAAGYVTKLQARGKGVYVYRPVEYNAEYADGITADGRKTLTLSMPYQNDPNVGISFADALLKLYKTKKLTIKNFTVEVNKSSTLMDWFIDYSFRQRVTLDFDDIGFDEDYLTQGYDMTLLINGNVIVKYYLLSTDYLPSNDTWRLGITGKTELGTTTILGF